MNTLLSHLLTAVAALAVAIVFHLWKGRARLVHGIPHLFSFTFGDESHISTQTVTAQNVGRKSANRVEMTFSNPPEYFAIFPQLKYDAHALGDGTYVIAFDYLAPRQVVTVELLASSSVMPTLVSMRSEDGMSKEHPISLSASVTTAGEMLLGVLFIAVPAFLLGWWLG